MPRRDTVTPPAVSDVDTPRRDRLSRSGPKRRDLRKRKLMGMSLPCRVHMAQHSSAWVDTVGSHVYGPPMQQTSTQRTAEAVRMAMARRQVRPGEIAKLLNCSRTTLWRRLDGKAPFDVEQLGLIAKRLDVPASTLLPEDAS